MSIIEEIIPILARELRQPLKCIIEQEHSLQEIRLRINKPILILLNGQEYYINIYGEKKPIIKDINFADSLCITREQIEEIMEYISKYSRYAFEEEIRQGYITIQGGHRVGLSGKVIMINERIHTLRQISCINLRIAHQIKGCADLVMPWIYENGQAVSSLVIGAPGSGKTTLLRDMIRQLSDGTKYASGKNVGLADERSELAACYHGIAQHDIGIRTDILDSCTKAEGMLMLLRSMNPKIIAADEIGTSKDIEAIRYISSCGCALLVSVHGNSLEELKDKPVLSELIELKIFKRYLILHNIKRKITIYNEEKKQIWKN